MNSDELLDSILTVPQSKGDYKSTAIFDEESTKKLLFKFWQDNANNTAPPEFIALLDFIWRRYSHSDIHRMLVGMGLDDYLSEKQVRDLILDTNGKVALKYLHSGKNLDLLLNSQNPLINSELLVHNASLITAEQARKLYQLVGGNAFLKACLCELDNLPPDLIDKLAWRNNYNKTILLSKGHLPSRVKGVAGILNILDQAFLSQLYQHHGNTVLCLPGGLNKLYKKNIISADQFSDILTHSRVLEVAYMHADCSISSIPPVTDEERADRVWGILEKSGGDIDLDILRDYINKRTQPKVSKKFIKGNINDLFAYMVVQRHWLSLENLLNLYKMNQSETAWAKILQRKPEIDHLLKPHNAQFALLTGDQDTLLSTLVKIVNRENIVNEKPGLSIGE